MNIRKERERMGMTQEELATGLGVAPNTVARLERGEMTLTRPMLLALCAVLKVKPPVA